MNKILAPVSLAIAALLPLPALAHSNVSLNIGVGIPGVVYAAPVPVYYAPPPPPVYYGYYAQPRVVIYPTAYYQNRVVYRDWGRAGYYGGGYGHGYHGRGDYDRGHHH